MYVILETMWEDSIQVISNEDGRTLLFDSKKKAEKEAENLQKGIVVEVYPEL